MLKIDRKNAIEQEVHRFVAFASDLGLKPGDFPERIETVFGNGQPFVRRRVIADGQAVTYAQSLGCITLTLLND